jgi:hypothetical protein
MKLITRSAIALVFLLGLATPLLAIPYVEVRISPPSGTCFTVTLKNLGAPVNVQSADLMVFDKMCKRVCTSQINLGNQKLETCQTMSFRICCEKARFLATICRVRVHHTGGINEQWYQ